MMKTYKIFFSVISPIFTEWSQMLQLFKREIQYCFSQTAQILLFQLLQNILAHLCI